MLESDCLTNVLRCAIIFRETQGERSSRQVPLYSSISLRQMIFFFYAIVIQKSWYHNDEKNLINIILANLITVFDITLHYQFKVMLCNKHKDIYRKIKLGNSILNLTPL